MSDLGSEPTSTGWSTIPDGGPTSAGLGDTGPAASAGLVLRVLGADGSWPGVPGPRGDWTTPDGLTSGYLVTYGATSLWLDAGTGTMGELRRHLALDDVSAVVISHRHPDHWSDLEHFAVACRWAGRRRGIPVYAPGGLSGAAPFSGDPAVLDWHDIDAASEVDIGDVHLRFSRTDHPVETLAVRVDAGGSSLGYSADTGAGWALSELGPGLDLALCEATFGAEEGGEVQHLNARAAGTMAADAGATRLVITHLGDGVDRPAARAAAEAAFGGEVGVAHTGAAYQL